MIEFFIPIPIINQDISAKFPINGNFTINSLHKILQDTFNEVHIALIKKYKEKRNDIADKLKETVFTSLKFEIEKVNENHYIIAINFPGKIKIQDEDNFCKFFRLEKYLGSILTLDKTYLSENILHFVKPLSVIEWCCNIMEYSYANHDEHLQLNKHDELLHVSFIDNNYFDHPVYKEIPKNLCLFL